jgi:hypothetical protein
MNNKRRRALAEVFAEPIPRSLAWARIETLLLSLGARRIVGSGSRVRFELNGVVASFHRPHPRKQAKPYQVRDARRFLKEAGIKP